MIYLLIKPKQIKLEKEENVNFTVKPIPGDSHCIVNCFLARTPPKFFLTMERILGKHSLIHGFQ